MAGSLDYILVWTKGSIVPGEDPTMWRRDHHGNLIRFDDYGNRDSVYGWEIDHITPGNVRGE